MVRIGSAKRDENGKGRGGEAGDQDGFEVCIEPWYLSSKGWNIIRAKDRVVRDKLATAMERACANDNIGYDKDERYSAYNWCKRHPESQFDPGRITEKVEVDCSALVRLCCAYAGIMVSDFYTGNEVSTLRATDKFDIIEDTKITDTSDYLLRGDILVTKTTGHTAIVLNDGAKANIELEVIGEATANKVMRVRDGKTVSDKIIGFVQKGETVPVVEIYENGWYKIKFEGLYAYTSNVNNAYYKFIAKNPVSYKTTGNLYIRKGPSTKYASCGYLKRGEIIEVGPIVKNWAVLADGRGYSSMKYLKKI